MFTFVVSKRNRKLAKTHIGFNIAPLLCHPKSCTLENLLITALYYHFPLISNCHPGLTLGLHKLYGPCISQSI